jgi:hypothetical protein
MIKPRRMRWERHAERIGEKRNAERVSVVKPEGKRPLGRPKRRCEDTIDGSDRVVWTAFIWLRDQWGGFCEYGN